MNRCDLGISQAGVFLYSRAKLIVALTHTFKSDIVNGGVDPAKVKVVTNGVDLNRFTPVARDKELPSSTGWMENLSAAMSALLEWRTALIPCLMLPR